MLKKKQLLLQYVVLFTLCYSTSVFSEEASKISSELLNRPSLNSSLWQMAMGLLLVLAVIFLLTWLMRKATGIQGTKGHIKIVSAINVGVKERAVLVEVGGEQLLLGVSAGRVNLLHKLQTPIASSAPDFAGSLKKATENLKNQDSKEA